MDSHLWKFKHSEGDSESPLASSLRLNELTELSLTRVRGSYPGFRIPPNSRLPGLSSHMRRSSRELASATSWFKPLRVEARSASSSRAAG
jgi:hypothetical protein